MINRTANLFQEGQTVSIQDGALVGSGVVSVTTISQATTVVASLFVRSVSGTVKVEVFTYTAEGEVKIIDFPLINAPTTQLLLKQAAATMSNIRVVITHSDDCDIAMALKGSNGGATSVLVIGPATARAYSASATTTTAVLVPSTLTDRQGLTLMNNGAGPILYVGFSSSQASTSEGWPIPQGGTLAMDLASGEEIYATASAGTIDVRIMESGS